MKTIFVTHESDVDGIFSAAIGLIRFPHSKVLFTTYGKENFSSIFEIIYNEVILSTENGQLVVSDLGLNDSTIDSVAELLNFLKSNQWSVIWIDHHPWSDEAKRTIKEEQSHRLILDNSGTLCASELVYREFLPGNFIAEKLAKIAHTTDFLTNDQQIPPLPELITYYKTLPQFYQKINNMAKKISQGILWDIEMQSEYNNYCNIRDIEKEKILKDIKIIENNIKNNYNTNNKITIAIVPLSPYLQVSIFSQEVFDKTHADVVFFFDKTGKVSIRRNNNKIKCNNIAKNLDEGGGHAYAAGGRLKSNPSNIEQVLQELKNALNNSFNE